jgi:phage shock protein C
MKQLRRSKNQIMLAGVLGGIAEYSGVDVTVVRLLFVLLAVFTAGIPMVVLYIIAFFIMPAAE